MKGVVPYDYKKAHGVDNREQYTEVLYSFRPNRFGDIEIAKWEGGKQPREIYTVKNGGKGKCNCLGSLRQPWCKHKKMLETVADIARKGGFGLSGCFWDSDRTLLYCPADGEGIPTDTSWMDTVVKAANS